MAPLDGGNFQGINPSMLQQLIKSLNSGVTGAQPLANSYVPQFARVGLDTGAVQKLLADYAWASAQQPMLNRRYSLASHQPSGDFTDGWTEEGAGALFYATTGAAKGAGTADAKQMQAYLDARDWSGIQKELDSMSQNGGDADYMAAFFSQLGPKGLYALSMYAQGGAVSNADEQDVKEAVGNGLATASYEMPLTMNFLQGIEPANPPAGYATAELAGGWDTAALAPFLTEGEFSDQWLKTISPSVLYQKSVEMGAPIPGGYDAIFQAMANNPSFAAQFYQQNTDARTGSDQLSQYMTDPLLYHYLASGPGFGAFLEAATIPPPGTTDTRQFTANAATFVQLFGDSGADTSTVVRQVMGAVATNYFTDLVGTVTAAAPFAGAGSTMGLPPQDSPTAKEWGQFVQDAMKDKTTAAYLLAYYGNWKGSQPLDTLAKHGTGDNSMTPIQAGYWHDSSTGLLDYFFASNYQAAGATAGSGSASVKGILVDAFNAGTATLLTSVIFGPEAAPMELLGEAGKDAFSSGTETAIGTITQKLADGGGDGGGPDGLDSNLTDIQSAWAGDVKTMWQQSGSKPGQPDFLAKSLYPKGYVEYNGKPYNGDPLPYEEQFSTAKDPKAGYFMSSDGQIQSDEYIAAHPQARAAYNAWLKDPAVSAQQGPLFSTENGGALMSMYQHLMSGNGSNG